MLIGLSLSESPDLARLGFGLQHLQEAMVELARHLLAAGHALAYGGDLRPGGFTETLRQLARAERVSSAKPRIHNFLAWPFYLQAADKDLADLAGIARIEKVPPPSPSVDAGAETPFARARALSAMRARMHARIDARVVLGGKLEGFSGAIPGLAEEVLLALEGEKPFYLIGAFGGCAGALVDGFRSRALPPALTEESFRRRLDDAGRQARIELLDELRRRAPKAPSLERLERAFRGHGADDVGRVNGLRREEHEVLFESPDLPELVRLVVNGLRRVEGRRARRR